MDKPSPGYLLVVSWPMTALGGVNEVVLNLAQQLGQNGYHPLIATPEAAANAIRGTELVPLRLDPPFVEHLILKPLLGFLVRAPKTVWRLKRLIDRLDIRVINWHYPTLGVFHFLLLRKLGLFRGRILLSFHGSDVNTIHQTRGIRRLAWRYLIANVQENVVCSEALRKSLLSFSPGARVTTIHNGSDRQLFLNSTKAMNAHPRTILQVAAFEAKKGHDVMLRALQLLRRTIPDARLILVGQKGPELDKIRNLIVELGLADSTELHLNVPHEAVPEFMRRADIFALPSRSEPFGLVLLEAGASQLPVVASRVGGIPELLENDVTGLLVDPGDAHALELALRELMLDPSKAALLARAWHLKSAQWTWERTCQRYLELS